VRFRLFNILATTIAMAASLVRCWATSCRQRGNPLSGLLSVRLLMLASVSLLTAWAVLAGALNLLVVHGRKFINQRPGWFYSLFVLLGFGLVIILNVLAPYIGWGHGAANAANQWLLTYLIGAGGAALAGLIAFFLVFAAYRLLRTRPAFTSLVFVITVVLALLVLGLAGRAGRPRRGGRRDGARPAATRDPTAATAGARPAAGRGAGRDCHRPARADRPRPAVWRLTRLSRCRSCAARRAANPTQTFWMFANTARSRCTPRPARPRPRRRPSPRQPMRPSSAGAQTLRCQACGRLNPAHLDVCQYCQARLKPLVAGGTPPATPAATPPALTGLGQADETQAPGANLMSRLRSMSASTPPPTAEPEPEPDEPVEPSPANWMSRLRGMTDSAPEPTGLDTAAASDEPDWMWTRRAPDRQPPNRTWAADEPAAPPPPVSPGSDELPDWLRDLAPHPAGMRQRPAAA
jgi:hypothetical protein